MIEGSGCVAGVMKGVLGWVRGGTRHWATNRGTTQRGEARSWVYEAYAVWGGAAAWKQARTVGVGGGGSSTRVGRKQHAGDGVKGDAEHDAYEWAAFLTQTSSGPKRCTKTIKSLRWTVPETAVLSTA